MAQLLHPNELTPERVVRFYGNVKYALDLLEKKKVSLVHVKLLNDPFDPYCFFETDFGESLSSLLYYVRMNHPKDYAWFRANLIDGRWCAQQNCGRSSTEFPSSRYPVSAQKAWRICS